MFCKSHPDSDKKQACYKYHVSFNQLFSVQKTISLIFIPLSFEKTAEQHFPVGFAGIFIKNILFDFTDKFNMKYVNKISLPLLITDFFAV